MRSALLLFSFCILVQSCSRPGPTIITDPAWYRIIEETGSQRETIAEVEDQQFVQLNYRIVQFSEGIEKVLEQEIVKSSHLGCILSPLLSEAVTGFDLTMDLDRCVFLDWGGAMGVSGGRVLRLLREEAFYKAGEYAYSFALNGDSATPSVGAIVFTGMESRRKELVAFTAGFSSQGSDVRLEVYEFDKLDEERKVQQALQKIREQRMTLVLVSASKLNGICMDTLAREKRAVILETAVPEGQIEENIAGFIDFNHTGLVSAAVDLLKTEEKEQVFQAFFMPIASENR